MHTDLNSALLKWFNQAHNNGVPVSGTFIKGKAADLAKQLGSAQTAGWTGSRKGTISIGEK